MILGGEGGAQMICHFNLNQNFPDVALSVETQLILSFPAMPFGDKFCVSRMDRTGGGGWVSAPKGCKQHGRVWAQL